MKPRRFVQVGFVVATWLACFRSEAAVSPFAIYLEFDQDAGPAGLTAMQQEVARIFAPAALEPTWRTTATRRTAEDFPLLLFVRLRGACTTAGQASPPTSNAGSARELASTAVSHGRVLPFTEIDCSELRRFLDATLVFSANPQALFGRALGRVLAHEAFHFLAAKTSHADEGVTRSAYRLRDLTAPELNLGLPEIAALRTAAGLDHHRGTTIASIKP